MSTLENLCQRLDYKPNNLTLLEQAITHRSFAGDNNERLEFLGDALLDLIIGEALFHQFSDKKEGVLSRYRAELVKGQTLAQLALELGLNEIIRLGSGERKSGGANRDSILADSFEALLGAIYLDSGFDQCQHVVQTLFKERLLTISSSAKDKDPKTALQEKLQAKKQGLPVYVLEKSSGQQHKQTFYVSCEVSELNKKIEEKGRSKKIAEQSAAAAMLALLEQEQLL